MNSRSFYTVSFATVEAPATEAVSRFFNTRRAANNWFRWLRSRPYTVSVSLYEGRAGGNLLKREAGTGVAA